MPKILAIDYGSKNIGLALSDDEQKISFPYSTIRVETRHASSLQNVEKAISDIEEICDKERVEKIIIGLPINLAGEKTSTTQQVENFILVLKNNLSLPIVTIDERLSTEQAHKLGANKKSADEVSAQILLQSWLDNKHFSTRL
jgi:putative Holliday junction resolvase